jgi:hypothetical protein
VTSAPSAEEVGAIEEAYPGTIVTVRAREGERLSERPDQDSYSYELAWISLGAQTHEELEKKYQAVTERLSFSFEEVGERGGVQV